MRRSPRPGSASSARSGARFRPPPAHRSGCSKFFASSRPITAPASPRALPVPARGDVSFRQCPLRLSDAAGCAGGRRRFAVGARRREGRDRRPVGRGQEHAVSSAAAVLRSGAGRDLVRRRADQGRRSARGALAHRAGAAGLGGVRRDRAREHPLRPARRHRCRGRARRRSRPRHRIHPPPAGRLRGAARRARRHAVGRPAPAHRDRARDPARRAAVAARRGDLVARCGIRDAGADRAGGIDAPPHHAGDRPSPRHRACPATASW